MVSDIAAYLLLPMMTAGSGGLEMTLQLFLSCLKNRSICPAGLDVTLQFSHHINLHQIGMAGERRFPF